LPEVAGLDIHDGPPKAGPFAAYELEPPPPPNLNNKGIVTMDITEQFTDAARSVSSRVYQCRHVLIPLQNLK
jgi:N-alpha-acetyltransferase 35, NatC auxiliary subunit